MNPNATDKALRRALWRTEEQPVRIILALMALGSLLAEAGSWVAQTPIPRIPIIPGIGLPQILETALWVGLSACCVGFGFTWAWRRCGLIFIALFLIAVVADVNRLSPYWFNYLCLGGALYFPKPSQSLDSNRWIRPTLTILGIQYLWAGINKVNPGFLRGGFLWFTEPYIAETQLPYWAIGCLMLLPLVEIGLGVGLFFRRTLIPAAFVGVVMHTILLIMLGPLGRNYGTAVWPWNLGLLALLVITMFKLGQNAAVWPPLQPLELAFVAVLAFIPVASLFGNYVYFASYRLYTMNDTRGTLFLEEGINPALDRERDGVTTESKRTISRIDLFSWALKNGNQPAYGDANIFKKSFQHLCPTDGRIARLVIKHRWSWLGQPTPETVTCSKSAKTSNASQ
jgi:hypothetical protein